MSAGSIAALSADFSDLKGGAVWAACERYYTAVENIKAKSDHYAIKDRSLLFLKRAKALKPRSQKEAFLFMECVNLANGNAHFANMQIRNAQVADDKFFKLLLNDTKNNSNAAQHEYMSKLDGKYNFALEIETAKETFDAEMNAARQAAMQYVMMIYTTALSTVNAQANADYSNYNYNNYNAASSKVSSFLTVAQLANQAYFASTNPPGAGPAGGWSGAGVGFGGPATPSTGGFTPAPVGPSKSAGTTNSKNPSAPPPGRIVGTPSSSQVAKAVVDTAPKADPACVHYALSKDAYVATVANRCDFPIEWRWCWIPRGKQSCTPDASSGLINPRKTMTVHGPADTEQPNAVSVVCNMTDKGKHCGL